MRVLGFRDWDLGLSPFTPRGFQRALARKEQAFRDCQEVGFIAGAFPHRGGGM